MSDTFTKNDRLLGTAGTDSDGKKGFYLETLSGGTGATADQVQGNVAHDAVDLGSPVKVGGQAHTNPSAVAQGDRANLWLNLQGATMLAGINAGAGSDAQAGFVALGLSDAATQTRPLSVGLHAFNGTTVDRARGDTNGLVMQKGLSSTIWNYSNGATGILSNTTTAVTIKTAAGASVRNYIDSLQITTTAFGTSVPIAIRDGAGGTILWAMNVPTAGYLQPVTIVFETPLKGTANTLLEIVTTTANTTGTVWVSAQGHTGA